MATPKVWAVDSIAKQVISRPALCMSFVSSGLSELLPESFSNACLKGLVLT
jgi:hypothetical protein